MVRLDGFEDTEEVGRSGREVRWVEVEDGGIWLHWNGGKT